MKIILAFFTVGILLLGCGNPCDDLDCGLNGTCNEDTEACVCDTYYEGTNCELEVRSRYLGSWSGKGECSYNTNAFDLTVNITQGVEVDEVMVQSTQILQEFSITGELDANNEIVFPTFMAHIGSNMHDGKIIELDATTIEMTLTAYVNGDPNTCVYTLSK